MGWGGVKNLNSIALNATKFCIHNQWVSKRLEIPKLTTPKWRGGSKNENLGSSTNLNLVFALCILYIRSLVEICRKG